MFPLVGGSLVMIEVFSELSEAFKDSIGIFPNYCSSPWTVVLRILQSTTAAGILQSDFPVWQKAKLILHVCSVPAQGLLLFIGKPKKMGQPMSVNLQQGQVEISWDVCEIWARAGTESGMARRGWLWQDFGKRSKWGAGEVSFIASAACNTK